MITIDIPIWAARLRARRRARLWSQAELGKRMAEAGDDSTRDRLPGEERLAGMVRSWEAGEQRPDELHAELLCRTFGTDEADLFVGDAAGTTLWHHLTDIPLMPESFSAEEEERTGRAIEDPGRADDQTAAYFSTVLRAYARTEHHPAGLADALSPVFDTIEALNRDVRSGIRQALLVLSSQGADLISRMHYEAGDLSEALAWSNRALMAAHQAGDERLVAYALTHRAGLRDAQDDPGQVIDLAVAAREHVVPRPPLDAMARLHEAQGHAMAGAEDMCHRRLEESAESPEAPGDDMPDMVGYPTGHPDALVAECLIELHHPADAIEILERDLRGAPAGYRTAYDMARLAHAYTDAHEGERSAAIAREAFDLSWRTGATRALWELRLIQDAIHGWAHRR